MYPFAKKTSLFFILKKLFSEQKKNDIIKQQAKDMLFTPTHKAKRTKMSNEMKSVVRSLQNDVYQVGKERDQEKDALLNNARPQDIFKLMDTSIDGFFSKRPYNLQNFNYLLQVLAEQKKIREAVGALEKMKTLGILPNVITYTHLITNCGKNQDLVKAEQYFRIACNDKNVKVSKQLFTSLIFSYARAHKPDEAFLIFREMKQKGLQPDLACYTTLLTAYKNTNQIEKCWDLYQEINLESNLVADDIVHSIMMRICAKTHNAEKAKAIFQQIEQKGGLGVCLPYNALIKALGSRKEYAQEAVDTFHKMLGIGITPDADSYIALLKATSLIGNIQEAYNAIMMMRQQKLKIDIYIYNGLLRTYAGAMSIPNLNTEIRDLYIQDAWNLFKQLQTDQNLPVTVNILNSLLLVHTQAHVIDKVEMYFDMRDLKTVFRLYDLQKEADREITFSMLCNYIESAMRTQDVERICDALRQFKKIQREPKMIYLKKLGESQNIPDVLYYELSQFDAKFGFVKDSVKRLQKPNAYSPM